MPQRVVIYASLGLRSGISDLLWAFRKKHTLEEFPVYLDDHPFQVHDRISQEMKYGLRTADIVFLPHYMTLRMSAEGLLTSHEPPELGAYPRNFYDKGLKWFAGGVTFMCMAYNSKRVRKGGLPTSLDDLTERRWEGRLGMQSLTTSKFGNIGAQYVAFLRRGVSERRWLGFLESLSGRNRPRTFDCIDHLIQGMLDDSHRISLTVYSLAYFREKTAGSPVASFEAEGIPRMLTFASVGLMRTAKENDSARRFLDFLLTEEAQKIVGTITGLSPSRPGLKTPYPFEAEYGPKSEFHPDGEDLRTLPQSLETFARLGLP
jgi:iron(III) transport system substrate-binding protein